MYELVKNQLHAVKDELPDGVELVAISKYHPAEAIAAAYEEGQRIFGESHEQELSRKHATLPQDIEWHFIGHLQTNKVKTVVPIVTLIHSVDSGKLLTAINAEAEKIGKIVDVLLELHVAQEETNYGFDLSDLVCLEKTGMLDNCRNVRVRGVMGMATNTDNETEIRKEFQRIVGVFREMKSGIMAKNPVFDIVSMGISDDYRIAVEEGSTMIRVGSHIFGPRQY